MLRMKREKRPIWNRLHSPGLMQVDRQTSLLTGSRLASIFMHVTRQVERVQTATDRGFLLFRFLWAHSLFGLFVFSQYILHLSDVCCGMLYICLKTGRALRKIKLEHYLFVNATANKPSVENSCNIFDQYIFYEVLQKAADLESGTCLFIL